MGLSLTSDTKEEIPCLGFTKEKPEGGKNVAAPLKMPSSRLTFRKSINSVGAFSNVSKAKIVLCRKYHVKSPA